MEILIEQGTEILIRVLVALILALAAYASKKLITWLESKLGQARYDTALAIVRDLIHAAEQRGLANDLWRVGKDKKVWVLDQLQAELDRQNIRIDLDQLDAMIEAEILRQFNWSKLDPDKPAITALPQYRPVETADCVDRS